VYNSTQEMGFLSDNQYFSDVREKEGEQWEIESCIYRQKKVVELDRPINK
jgi:hypothetical protein